MFAIGIIFVSFEILIGNFGNLNTHDEKYGGWLPSVN